MKSELVKQIYICGRCFIDVTMMNYS